MSDTTSTVTKDTSGYYAALGVLPAATADEIKAAYRHSAKELHPDRNHRADAKARFQAINDAYHILGDAARRSAYDASHHGGDRPAPADTKLDPIRCSVCNRITPLPRSIVFQRVYSTLVATIRRPVEGIFCAACARKTALKASLISAIAGWWALPWGPIHTVAAIARNSWGGRQEARSAQQLAWHNAQAFYSQGELSQAYALARRLRSASDPNIALNASRLAGELRGLVIQRSGVSLRNPWRFHPLDFLAHSVLIAAVPAALVGIVLQSHIAAWMNDRGAPQRATADATAPTSQTADAICAAPPHNGDVLGGYLHTAAPGHLLTIIDGSSSNAIVKVRDVAAGRVAVSFFIANHSVASYALLPDGAYRIQFALGDVLAPDCRSFREIATAGEFLNVETLRGAGVPLTYSIDTVAGSAAQAQPIDAASFNAD
jgi:curved DNA-binding protein CbpA